MSAQIEYFRPELIAAALRLNWHKFDRAGFEKLQVERELPITAQSQLKLSALYREAQSKTQDPATKQTLGIIARAIDLWTFPKEGTHD